MSKSKVGSSLSRNNTPSEVGHRERLGGRAKGMLKSKLGSGLSRNNTPVEVEHKQETDRGGQFP
jgi:hypothetical protein